MSRESEGDIEGLTVDVKDTTGEHNETKEKRKEEIQKRVSKGDDRGTK